ncbi:hypothetical protein ACLMJK_005719 [Lecanora helva]
MPRIVQGQVFPSLQAFKNALRDWAIERNWTPHILDSDSHRVRAGCRSSGDCPFRIRANYSTKRGDAKVTTCDDNHTCEPFRATTEARAHQDIKRAETGKLKFLLEAVPKLMTVTLDTNVTEIIDTVERKYGQKIPTRQAQKVKASLIDRVKGPCRHCHQLGHTRKHCPQLHPPPTTSGAVPFPNVSQELPSFAHDDSNDAAYADGGLELDHETDRTMDANQYIGSHQQNDHRPMVTQPQQGPSATHYSNVQSSEIPMDPTLPTAPPRISPRQMPVTEQPTIVQNHSIMTPMMPEPNVNLHQPSPQETRLEAARLMQQAAGLMQEAARLNSEAARLTASVANS